MDQARWRSALFSLLASARSRYSRAPRRRLPAAFETKAKHAILMDADANLVLFEKDADTLGPACQHEQADDAGHRVPRVESGAAQTRDQFKVSEHAWRTGGAPSGGSAMFAPLNTMVSISDLIQGITVQSGNDAAIILAEGIGGREEAFAKQMTEYSRTIGLEKSTFVNATGLPAEGHLMTVRDLARSPAISSTPIRSTITSSARRSSSTATSSCSITAIRSSRWISASTD